MTEQTGLARREEPLPATAAQMAAIDPARTGAQLANVELFLKAQMKRGVHYGKVPGVDKDFLWKSGAELLAAGLGLSGIEAGAGDAKVHHLYGAPGGDHDVGRLDVAMNDVKRRAVARWLLGPSRVEGVCGLGGHLECGAEGELADMGEVDTVDGLHENGQPPVDSCEPVDAHDRRVTEEGQ